MDRNKLIAIVVGALSALGVVAYGLGTAEASTWHDYEGDVFAGHAYGLQVPPGAQAYEIALSGDDAATAKVAMFDPSGAPLGYYALSKSLPSASVVAPQAGRHFLYVYDLQEGALSLRVDAASPPSAIDLAKIALSRQDLDVGSQEAPAKLDKVFTAKVASAPVFVTLLYEGSAQGLDATVASPKGDVATIRGESGTAFSPGVWTSQTGTRESDPGNLDGTIYTVTVHAAKFEGRLVLTTLALDLKAPPLPPTATPAPAPMPGAPVSDPIVAHTGAAFALPVGKAIAFEAPKGALHLAPFPDRSHGHARHHGNETNETNESCDVATLSIYAPDDSLLAYVALDPDEPQATVDLPEAGEYVAYVHQSTGKGVLAQIEGATAVPTRALALAEETTTFDASSFILSENDGEPFTLASVPVALKLRIGDDATAVLADVWVHNANGLVAAASSPASVPGGDWFAWSHQDPENFAAGEHTLVVNGVLEGRVTLTSVHYQRDVAEPAAPEEATHAATPPAPPEPPTPPAPPGPPMPPELPSAAPALPVADALFALFG